MTIASRGRVTIVLLAVAFALGLSGCAGKQWYRDAVARSAAPARAPQRHAAPTRIAQLNFGSQSRFAVCIPPACPTVTRKTLPSRAQLQAAARVAGQGAGAADAPAAAAEPVPSPRMTRQGLGPGDGEQVLILFAHNSHALDDKARRALDQFATTAREAHAIVVSGRTDAVGSQELNRRLASARARAVADYLATMGPGVRRKIRIDAQGACCYIASNAAGVGRHANRRVEVTFMTERSGR